MPTVLTAAPPVSFSSRPSHWLSQENFDVQVSLARNCFFLLVHSFLLTKWKMKGNPDLGGYTTFTEDSPFTKLPRRSQPLNWFPRSAVSVQWRTWLPTCIHFHIFYGFFQLGKKFLFFFFFVFVFLLSFIFFLFSFLSFLFLVFLSYFLLKSSNTPLLFLNFHFH